MKVLKRVLRPVDIGDLYHVLRLPMAARIRVGLETTCDVCGLAITDDFFLAGFVKGHINLKLHEACSPMQPTTAEAD